MTRKQLCSRSAGKGGQGGGGRPPNVLQDHFSNSSNSGVKIAGGGGKADDLGSSNVYECIGFYNLAILIAFAHDLYGTESNFFLLVKSQTPVLRTLSVCLFHQHSLWRT